ncbi:MAG: hypothetical protein KME50_24375 [Nostoc desertorum CM1-VF14]|nr:hypothetical protein [Nostoc desertorum CM1-VF14]
MSLSDLPRIIERLRASFVGNVKKYFANSIKREQNSVDSTIHFPLTEQYWDAPSSWALGAATLRHRL